MLHTTLPRAFLPPGLSYLGGYYGEDAHLYNSAAGYVPCIEDPYARVPDQRVHSDGWEASARPTSPSPLDLSLKPPRRSNPVGSVEFEVVGLDDDDDRRCRGADRRRVLPVKRSYSHCEDRRIEEADSDIHESPSIDGYRGYDDATPRKELAERRSSPEDNAIGGPPPVHRYHSYEDVPTRIGLPEAREVSLESLPTPGPASFASSLTDPETHRALAARRESLPASPDHSRTHGYHRQLLLTPQHHLQGIHAPMTPPSTPSPPQCPRRRAREDPDVTPPLSSATRSIATPKSTVAPSEKPGSRPKKKHARRLKFDEDTSSPVSGTVILGPDEAVVTGDIDPAFNIVEVTEEARAELAKIENRLGPYRCKLCGQLHEDAFQLAQHRCSRIAHVEYRCPECDKRFSCPANLASHRRWHKPRIPNGENVSGTGTTATSNTSTNVGDPEIACARCDAKFTRPAALRKHLATQHPEANDDVTAANDDDNPGFHDLNGSASGKTTRAPGTAHLVDAFLANEIP